MKSEPTVSDAAKQHPRKPGCCWRSLALARASIISQGGERQQVASPPWDGAALTTPALIQQGPELLCSRDTSLSSGRLLEEHRSPPALDSTLPCTPSSEEFATGLLGRAASGTSLTPHEPTSDALVVLILLQVPPAMGHSLCTSPELDLPLPA